MSRRRLAVLVLPAVALAAPSLLGCPRAVPEALAKHGYERVASNVLEAPSGAASGASADRFVRAKVLVHYHAGKPVWGFQAEAERKLVITRRAAPPASSAAPSSSSSAAAPTPTPLPESDVVLRLGYRRARWSDDPAEFLRWTDGPTWALRLAPDAHALALSDDGGARWGYVAMDLPAASVAPASPLAPDPGPPADEPFACLHLRAEASDRDLWSVLPTTRELSRAILQTHVEQGRVIGHPDDEGVGFEPNELRGALRYACAHPEDAALGREVGAALTRDGISASIWDLPSRQKVVACLGRFAKADEGTREALAAVLREAAPRALEARSWAAEGLASVPDASVQLLLARDLERLIGDKPRFGQCDLAAREGWALAAITTARADAPPEVEAALARLAKSDVGCLGGPTMDLVRAHAIRALAAIPRDGARAIVDQLASGCDAALPRWPASFEHEWEAANRPDWTVTKVACWAAAARARR